jgi:hypothetical protein
MNYPTRATPRLTDGAEFSMESHMSSSQPFPVVGAGVGVFDPFAIGVIVPATVLGLRPPETRLWKSTLATEVLTELLEAIADRSSTRCESLKCCACSFSMRSESDLITLSEWTL